jgi:hypothetical protein
MSVAEWLQHHPLQVDLEENINFPGSKIEELVDSGTSLVCCSLMIGFVEFLWRHRRVQRGGHCSYLYATFNVDNIPKELKGLVCL